MSSSSSSIETEKLKIQKKFSRRIIHEASNANYEPHEIGSLIDIILTSLNLETEEEVFSFILKCRIHDPLVISSITKIELNSVQLIDLMLLEGKNRFLINIEEAFEQGLLSLKDQDTREHLYERSIDWTEEDILRYVIKLCQHAPSKRICGMLLAHFTANMSSAQEAIGFIDDVISHDFFHDLRGSLADLLQYIPDHRSELMQLFEHRQSLKDGELIDSDEDEDGNLRDFVVDDDYQSTDSDQDNSPAKELKTKKKKQAKYDTEEAADTTVDLTTLDSPTIFENSKKKTRFTVHDDDNNND